MHLLGRSFDWVRVRHDDFDRPNEDIPDLADTTPSEQHTDADVTGVNFDRGWRWNNHDGARPPEGLFGNGPGALPEPLTALGRPVGPHLL